MTHAHTAPASATPTAGPAGSTDVVLVPRYHTADLLFLAFAVAMALLIAVGTFVAAHESHQRARDRARIEP